MIREAKLRASFQAPGSVRISVAPPPAPPESPALSSVVPGPPPFQPAAGIDEPLAELAPTPPTSSNDTNIATTAWVKTSGNGVVHTTGNETIAGIKTFNKAYEDGIFNKLYSTNLSYVPDEYKQMPWFEEVDCSSKVATIISNLNEGKSIRSILNGKEETAQKIKTLRR